MKHIIQFSGGAASAYAAYLVAKEHGKENTILLFHDTKAEHKDSYRFRSQVSEFLGIPITEYSDGRDLWEVIKDNNCLPSQFIPFCTRILKQEPAEKFLKNFNEEYILYNGFGVEEFRRVQKVKARAELLNRTVKSPLFELKIKSEEVKRIIKDEWKICLPEAYKYLQHNNCIPCFKAGKSHFKAVWKYFPKEFNKAKEMEKLIGNTVFQEYSLEELEGQWENGQLEMFDIEESIPCMCAA